MVVNGSSFAGLFSIWQCSFIGHEKELFAHYCTFWMKGNQGSFDLRLLIEFLTILQGYKTPNASFLSLSSTHNLGDHTYCLSMIIKSPLKVGSHLISKKLRYVLGTKPGSVYISLECKKISKCSFPWKIVDDFYIQSSQLQSYAQSAMRQSKANFQDSAYHHFPCNLDIFQFFWLGNSTEPQCACPF